MSITPETYHKLVKISELSTLNRNTSIQLVGVVSLYDEQNLKIHLNDTFGDLFIDLGKTPEIPLTQGKVVRVFGNWDSIGITVEKILEWDIVPEKIPILFSST